MSSKQTNAQAGVAQEQRRVIIEGVTPEIDAGAFPIKRTVGERVVVEVDLVVDGHDELSGVVMYRHVDDPDWHEEPLAFVVNDRWRASFPAERMGRYVYTIEAWVDDFATWQHGLRKKVEAGQNVGVELETGAGMIVAAARRAKGEAPVRLRELAGIVGRKGTQAESSELALGEELSGLMRSNPDRSRATRYERQLEVVVDRERARFCAWYEMFPRSASAKPGRHGTLRDVIARLPYVASMGFDVLYLPPIHPIGHTARKGRNNTEDAQPGDPGSPWAIGSEEGGHKSIHPELGTLEDFQALVEAARQHGLEVAMDIAFQCSPDHPYVREHP